LSGVELKQRPTVSLSPVHIEAASELNGLSARWPTTCTTGDARCFPFQCADVLDIWCGTIGRAQGIEPVFVAVTSADRKPLMLLALGIERVNGVRVLRFLDGGVSDYNAPILFPEIETLGLEDCALWKQIQSHLPAYDLAVLEKMPDSVDGIRNPLASLTTGARHESCHHVTLQGDWADFQSKRLPNHRDSRRRLRNLEKRAPVRFKIADGEQERQRVFNALIRMKRHRFSDTAAHDIFADGGYLQFYADATRKLGAKGTVQVSALYAGDHVIAANWGLYCNGRYIDLVPSYEAGEWRQFAPGRLLAEWLLQQHLERGDSVFDYGIGDEPYKFGYCDQHSTLGDAYLPATAKGMAYNAMLQFQLIAKSKLRDTRVGPALKVARSYFTRLGRGRVAPALGDTAPAWIALIGSISLAVDA
jgi:CelD/BcsL family acetyltransferase involved in cellulose biosynthesis